MRIPRKPGTGGVRVEAMPWPILRGADELPCLNWLCERSCVRSGTVPDVLAKAQIGAEGTVWWSSHRANPNARRELTSEASEQVRDASHRCRHAPRSRILQGLKFIRPRAEFVEFPLG